MLDRRYLRADVPLILAHRGASDISPENTLAAFQAAIDVGADGVELDVMRCATGEIVVIHDHSVARTTNGTGKVNALPLAALRELDAGAWFAPRYVGERVPLLEESLEIAGGRAIINIEIKARGWRSDGIEGEIVEMIATRDLSSSVIVSSFDPRVLTRVRMCGRLHTGLLYSTRKWAYVGLARVLTRPNAMHPHFSTVDERYVHWARRKGYRVNVWTVNERSDIERMVALGVDAIITNRPALAREVVDQ